MEYLIRAHPKSSRRKVELRDGVYHVWIHSAPEKGNANDEILAVFAEYLSVPRSRLLLVSGARGRSKKILLKD